MPSARSASTSANCRTSATPSPSTPQPDLLGSPDHDHPGPLREDAACPGSVIFGLAAHSGTGFGDAYAAGQAGACSAKAGSQPARSRWATGIWWAPVPLEGVAHDTGRIPAHVSGVGGDERQPP